jgi:hypothetical protein
MMMPPGFQAPNHHHPMFGGVNPTAAPPPHLPGSAGAIAAQQHAVASARGPTQHRFQPYEDNGGTTIGISGKDFAILGSDSRLSRGYSILCRDSAKQIQLTDNCVLVSAGMKADRDTLHKVQKRLRTLSSSSLPLTVRSPDRFPTASGVILVPPQQMLKTRLTMYEHQHGKPMSTPVRPPLSKPRPAECATPECTDRCLGRPSPSCCPPRCTTAASSRFTPSMCSGDSMKTVRVDHITSR